MNSADPPSTPPLPPAQRSRTARAAVIATTITALMAVPMFIPGVNFVYFLVISALMSGAADAIPGLGSTRNGFFVPSGAAWIRLAAATWLTWFALLRLALPPNQEKTEP